MDESMLNLYEVLGLKKDQLGKDDDANDALIKKMYKKACLQKHPDKGGSHLDMLRVNNAKKFLMTPNSRELYNRTIRLNKDFCKIQEELNSEKTRSKHMEKQLKDARQTVQQKCLVIQKHDERWTQMLMKEEEQKQEINDLKAQIENNDAINNTIMKVNEDLNSNLKDLRVAAGQEIKRALVPLKKAILKTSIQAKKPSAADQFVIINQKIKRYLESDFNAQFTER